MSFGPAMLRKVEEVRGACLAAASGATDADDTSREAAPLFRDFVAGSWKAACYDHCKPSTQRNYGGVLKRRLLPAFGSRRLDRIARSMTLSWFEDCSRTTPGAANEA